MKPAVRQLVIVSLCGAMACGEPTAPARPRILWRDASDADPTRPLLIDSVAVFGTFDGRAIAYHSRTGRVVWSRKLGPTIWGEAIMTAAGLVLVPEYELWALSPTDGTVRWRFAGPDGASGVDDPALSGDTLYVGSDLGWASAVNAQTGEAIWSVDLEERPFRPTIAGAFVVYGTRGFFGAGPREGPLGAGHVVALRRETGEVAWKFALPDSAGFPMSGGALSGGVVWRDQLIVGSAASRLYALRVSDGSLIWEHVGGSPPRAGYYRRPVALGESVFAIRQDGLLEALHGGTGAVQWTASIGDPLGDPVAIGSLLYVAPGPLWAFDEGGRVRGRWAGPDAGGPIFSSTPVLGPDNVFYLSGAELNEDFGSAYAIALPLRP